jgi:hypothetical protein
MDPVEFLTAIIEASVALIGFSGLVVALGRRSSGEWSVLDKYRLTILLTVGFILLACTLIALILLSAALSHAVVWALSSAVWVVLVIPFAVWVVSREVIRNPEEPTRSASYSGVNLAVAAGRLGGKICGSS